MKKFYNDLYKTQVKVGIFTVVILAVLVVGYLWLSSRISMYSQRDLQISFDDVMGLEIGDKAMFRGMEVGRIKNIIARSDAIVVTAKIRSDVQLSEDASFYISDSSLMGGTALNISQGGKGRELNWKLVHKGESPAGIMSILGKATTTIDEINAVLRDLRKEDGLIVKSGTLLDNADSAMRSVDELAIGTRIELTSTLNKIEHLTGQVNQIVTANTDNVNSALSKTPATMNNLNTTLDSLQVLSSKLGTTINDLNSGKGTAGRLLNDEELYTKLLQSVNNLDTLVQDIKANPKKYIKFSIF